MKRRILLALTLFLSGWVLSRLPWERGFTVWAVATPGVAGDVNADGVLNLGDPVHLLRFLFQGGPAPSSCEAASPPISIAFMVRHAEKAATPAEDPGLTPEGTERAKRLAEIFKYAKIDKLIASDKLRTQETLAPLAAQTGLPIADKVGDEGAVEVSAVGVSGFLKNYPPGTVSVVAHHSTTIRAILEELGIPKEQAQSVNTSLYDNLILVLLPVGQTPQMVKLRYP